MSNSLAIATVTGTLLTRVQGLLNGAGLNDFGVTAGHPRSNPEPGVYITLYQLSPHPGLRNLDLPTRAGDGSARQRPVLALTMRYLFSFVGDSERLDPERLAGLVLADLHARPLLGNEEITAYLGTLSGNHPLRASDLAEQPQTVKLTPLSQDTEELSRVWGLFNQSLYALSMAWEATAVLLDGNLEPAPGLPVASVGLAVVPAMRPVLERLYEETLRQPVLESSQALVVEGGSLLGERSTLVVGDARRDVGPADITTEGALRVPLASVLGLRPGVQTVRLEHQVQVPGATGGWRSGGVSNALAVMVLPAIGAVSSSATGTGTQRRVRVTMTPLPGEGQNAELLLDAGSARRSSRDFELDAGDMVFTVADLPNGSWRLRVIVDGAMSRPTMTAGVYSGPTLVVP